MSEFIDEGQPSAPTPKVFPLDRLDGLTLEVLPGLNIRITAADNPRHIRYIDEERQELALGYIEGVYGAEVEYYVIRAVGDARAARIVQVQNPNLYPMIYQETVESTLQSLGYTSRTDGDARVLLPNHRRVIYHDLVPDIVHHLRKKNPNAHMVPDLSKIICSADGTSLMIPRLVEDDYNPLRFREPVPCGELTSNNALFPFKHIKGLEFDHRGQRFSWRRWIGEPEFKEFRYQYEDSDNPHFTRGRFGLRNDGALHVQVRYKEDYLQGEVNGLPSSIRHRYYWDGDDFWMVVSLTDEMDRWEEIDQWHGDERAQALVKKLTGNRQWLMQMEMHYFPLTKGKPYPNQAVAWGIDGFQYGTEEQMRSVTHGAMEVARHGKNYDELKDSIYGPALYWFAAYPKTELPKAEDPSPKPERLPVASGAVGVPDEIEAPPLIRVSEGGVSGSGWSGFSGLWKKLFGR